MKQALLCLSVLAVLVAPFCHTSAQITAYVDHTATGLNNGHTWEDAYTSLKTALDSTASGEIWVAAGAYKPTTTIDRTKHFQLKNNLAIYGGFNGTETNLSQRDYETNLTYLSGNIGDPLDDADNSFNVVYGLLVDSTAILDGFIISEGYAGEISPPTSNDAAGGGIYLMGAGPGSYSNPIIQNCVIISNYAHSGGGMFANGSQGGKCNPTFTNCRFENNNANIGGGLDNFGFSGEASGIFTDCSFINNYADAGGGAYNNGNDGISNPIYNNCVFEGNTANNGGAMYSNGAANGHTEPYLESCSFTDNSVNFNGGAFYNRGKEGLCRIDLFNCTFAGNSCPGNGGAMFNEGFNSGDFHLSIINCSFGGNSAGISGGVIYSDASNGGVGVMDIQNCIFFSNTAPVDPVFSNINTGIFTAYSIYDVNSCADLGSGTNCGTKAQFLTDNPFADVANNDLRLRACGLAIDFGNNAVNAKPTDILGNNRVNSGIIDVGAYEFNASSLHLPILDNNNQQLLADTEFTSPNGWTHYCNCNSGFLLLSVKKGAENIGSVGDGTFVLEAANTVNYGSNQGVDLSGADYALALDTALIAMNRYWHVTPNGTINDSVKIRFYYDAQDLADVQGSLPFPISENELSFYKVENTDPYATNVSVVDFTSYKFDAGHPSTQAWSLGNFEGISYSEFAVEEFSSGSGGYMGATNMVFPFVLADFQAQIQKERDVLLSWATASELQSDRFEVQRSANGTDFAPIASVQAAGSSQELTFYEYLDFQVPPGQYFYRLKLIDIDGSFSYSELRSIQVKASKIRTYPNPFIDQINVELAQETSGRIGLKLYHLDGKQIWHQNTEVQGQSFSLHMPQLSSGIYLLKIMIPGSGSQLIKIERE